MYACPQAQYSNPMERARASVCEDQSHRADRSIAPNRLNEPSAPGGFAPIARRRTSSADFDPIHRLPSLAKTRSREWQSQGPEVGLTSSSAGPAACARVTDRGASPVRRKGATSASSIETIWNERGRRWPHRLLQEAPNLAFVGASGTTTRTVVPFRLDASSSVPPSC